MATFSKKLEDFCKELVPSDEFLKTGKETADYIFRLLQTSKLYSVDRSKIVGSTGKSTAICVSPDIDLVVFLNNEHPPFKAVLDNFEDILTKSNMDIKNIKVTKFSIQFTASNIEFDLLPAPNFVPAGKSHPGTAEMANIQAYSVMKHVIKNPSEGYKYGSAVCEKNLEFLKKQTPFVHDVIRLAKYWNKTLHLGVYISGRSSMIELVAIQAGIFQEKSGVRSSSQAFRVFLTLMSNFDNLQVIFYDNYKEDQIRSDVKRQRPLILDPVNPYNNFAYFSHRKREGIIQNFKKYAAETLARFDREEDLTDLFEVQPRVIMSGPQPEKWALGTTELTLANPTMQVNPRVSDKDFKSKNWGVKQIQDCLLTSMAALTLGGKVEEEKVRDRVERVVDLNILGLPAPRGWVSSPANFDDFDFKLSVPIPGEKNRCIILGGSF